METSLGTLMENCKITSSNRVAFESQPDLSAYFTQATATYFPIVVRAEMVDTQLHLETCAILKRS